MCACACLCVCVWVGCVSLLCFEYRDLRVCVCVWAYACTCMFVCCCMPQGVTLVSVFYSCNLLRSDQTANKPSQSLLLFHSLSPSLSLRLSLSVSFIFYVPLPRSLSVWSLCLFPLQRGASGSNAGGERSSERKREEGEA